MRISEPVNSTTSMDVEGGDDYVLAQDLDDILAAFSPQNAAGASGRKGQARTPHFRVRWHADIIVEDHSKHRGYINDISTLGASIYLTSSLSPVSPTIHIHVPPLDPASKPRIIRISGRTVYVVYDGERQLYRAAVNFIRFHSESDRAFLDERLNKHQVKIPELEYLN